MARKKLKPIKLRSDNYVLRAQAAQLAALFIQQARAKNELTVDMLAERLGLPPDLLERLESLHNTHVVPLTFLLRVAKVCNVGVRISPVRPTQKERLAAIEWAVKNVPEKKT